MTFVPRDPDFEGRARRAFERQTLMTTVGARLVSVTPGECVIDLPVAPHILQQHGFVHGGAVATIADTACGIAAASLMAAGTGVLTVEFKLNLLAPARGEKLVATGKVERPGRTITVTTGRVEAVEGGKRTTVALVMATMMTMEGRDGVRD